MDEQPGTSKTRHETDDDNEVQRKKMKLNYECKFQDEWIKRSEYKWLRKVGKTTALCSKYNIKFTVKYDCEKAVKTHLKSQKT
jgi:hypothetical protein